MLITTENEVIWGTDDMGGAAICFKKPVECPRCHRMICLAVNRAGKTLCVVCDGEERKKTP